ncbi:hypothetical protein [Streptomyces sp. NPDC102487]|uniref:hypothetical protein n=1 Tax=Streptomyces sp. NPDC102487 TaxID=3366182 RepID=UPI003830AD74
MTSVSSEFARMRGVGSMGRSGSRDNVIPLTRAQGRRQGAESSWIMADALKSLAEKSTGCAEAGAGRIVQNTFHITEAGDGCDRAPSRQPARIGWQFTKAKELVLVIDTN